MPRWCETIRMPDGGFAIVTFSGPRPKAKRCQWPGCKTASTLQCDYPLLHGQTCDRYLCRAHAINVGPDRDYCRHHPQDTP